MLAPLDRNLPDARDVEWSAVDFIDLGSSRGGSLAYCADRFGGARGVGVDRNPAKVAEARSIGLNAVVGDATRLDAENVVRFVSMFDFLEHLPSLALAAQVIGQAARAATDFLFIRHPSFEGEGLLEAHGVCQYWWRWRGHTNHMRIADYCAIFSRLHLHQYCIHFNDPILTTAHRSILPADAPADSFQYDAAIHGPKDVLPLPQGVWRSQSIFVALRSFTPAEWSALAGSS